jgi:hypothetical protein
VPGFALIYFLQEGRTPLHYAAALQGTTGGLNQLYNILTEHGADENVVDVVRKNINWGFKKNTNAYNV